MREWDASGGNSRSGFLISNGPVVSSKDPVSGISLSLIFCKAEIIYEDCKQSVSGQNTWLKKQRFLGSALSFRPYHFKEHSPVKWPLPRIILMYIHEAEHCDNTQAKVPSLFTQGEAMYKKVRERYDYLHTCMVTVLFESCPILTSP